MHNDIITMVANDRLKTVGRSVFQTASVCEIYVPESK